MTDNMENKVLNEQELGEVVGGVGDANQRYVRYTVVKGDNLTRIANRFRTTIAEIMRLNPIITNKNMIRIGWVLLIPDNR